MTMALSFCSFNGLLSQQPVTMCCPSSNTLNTSELTVTCSATCHHITLSTLFHCYIFYLVLVLFLIMKCEFSVKKSLCFRKLRLMHYSEHVKPVTSAMLFVVRRWTIPLSAVSNCCMWSVEVL